MKEIICIFLGGGLGSVFRYLCHLSINDRGLLLAFPWSTFTVNVFGSFLIGIFYALSARFHLPDEVRLFLTVGLCGGFTTFSAFSGESLSLFKEGMYLALAAYVVLSVVLGMLAVFAGVYLINKL